MEKKILRNNARGKINTETQEKGTGLGLGSLAKHLHGGKHPQTVQSLRLEICTSLL